MIAVIVPGACSKVSIAIEFAEVVVVALTKPSDARDCGSKLLLSDPSQE